MGLEQSATQSAHNGRAGAAISLVLGRPSVLEASIERRDGEIVSAHMAGECVLVSEGWIDVG